MKSALTIFLRSATVRSVDARVEGVNSLNFKKNHRTGALVVAGLIGSAMAAFAVTEIPMTGSISMSNVYNNTSPGRYGGEFAMTIDIPNTAVDPQFRTFCLEYGEAIYLNRNYTYAVNGLADGSGLTAAVNGGPLSNGGTVPFGSENFGTGTRDPISVGTAWLYSTFRQGALPGVPNPADADDDSAYITAQDQGYLQEAFWWLEGELSGLSSASPAYGSGNYYVAYVKDILGKDDQTIRLNAEGSDRYGVSVLNLTTVGATTTLLRQDVLWWEPSIPTGGETPVSDQGRTWVLLGAVLPGVIYFSRRLRAVTR